MPLVPYSLTIIRDQIAHAKACIPDRKIRVLTLSTPDLIAHQAQLEAIFGKEVISRCTVREDSEATLNWHKAHQICKKVYDTRSLFESLGCEYCAVDTVQGRGGEVDWDLNLSWSDSIIERFGKQFDVVFDCISNQVFNVHQAMCNAWGAVQVGGCIVHVIPVQMVNQGFWGVSPAAYYDFYRVNHGNLELFEHVVGVYAEKRRVQLDHIKRERLVPDDTMNVVVARKQRESYTAAPMMTKFPSVSDVPKMTKLAEMLPAMYREMHAANAFKGDSWRQHLRGLNEVLALRPSGAILDYGCGPTGGLKTHFNSTIPYDPYVEQYAEDPWKKSFDVFFSSDVFEHLPLEDLLQLTRRICKHSKISIVFIALSTRHANKIMPNGLNAHLTVRSAQWWKGFFESQFFSHFRIVTMQADLLKEEAVFAFTRFGAEADDPRDTPEPT